MIDYVLLSQVLPEHAAELARDGIYSAERLIAACAVGLYPEFKAKADELHARFPSLPIWQRRFEGGILDGQWEDVPAGEDPAAGIIMTHAAGKMRGYLPVKMSAEGPFISAFIGHQIYLYVPMLDFDWDLENWGEPKDGKKGLSSKELAKQARKEKAGVKEEKPKPEKKAEEKKEEKPTEGSGGFGKAVEGRTPEEEAILFAPKSSPVEDYVREIWGEKYLEFWKRRYYRFEDFDVNPAPKDPPDQC